MCGESLSELTDVIVPKLFNSLATNETKNEGNEGNESLEEWAEAVSVVRVMKILPEVLSSRSLIVRKEILLRLNKEIHTYYKK